MGVSVGVGMRVGVGGCGCAWVRGCALGSIPAGRTRHRCLLRARLASPHLASPPAAIAGGAAPLRPTVDPCTRRLDNVNRVNIEKAVGLVIGLVALSSILMLIIRGGKDAHIQHFIMARRVARLLAAGCWLLVAAGCCWLLLAAGCWLAGACAREGG